MAAPWITMTTLRAEFLSYLKGLIIAGKPYQSITASRALGRTRDAVNRDLHAFRGNGIITTEIRRDGGFTMVRVTIAGLGTTPWPTVRDPEQPEKVAATAKHGLSEAEILARRLETERAHADRQKWLARERRDWKRPERVLDGAESAVARAYGFRL